MNGKGHLQRRVPAAVVAVVLGLVLVLAGCGDDDGDDGGASSPAATEPAGTGDGGGSGDDALDDVGEDDPSGDAEIVIEDRTFRVDNPVELGGALSVENLDDVPHTVTADPPATFDLEMAAGDSDVFIPSLPGSGSYTFHCRIHPEMRGTLEAE